MWHGLLLGAHERVLGNVRARRGLANHGDRAKRRLIGDQWRLSSAKRGTTLLSRAERQLLQRKRPHRAFRCHEHILPAVHGIALRSVFDRAYLRMPERPP